MAHAWTKARRGPTAWSCLLDQKNAGLSGKPYNAAQWPSTHESLFPLEATRALAGIAPARYRARVRHFIADRTTPVLAWCGRLVVREDAQASPARGDIGEPWKSGRGTTAPRGIVVVEPEVGRTRVPSNGIGRVLQHSGGRRSRPRGSCTRRVQNAQRRQDVLPASNVVGNSGRLASSTLRDYPRVIRRCGSSMPIRLTAFARFQRASALGKPATLN